MEFYLHQYRLPNGLEELLDYQQNMQKKFVEEQGLIQKYLEVS